MKQKNMILMVVAVGCGLVAAFLTSQMNAKPSAPEVWDVLVAAKDLPVGTYISKDELKNLVKFKKVPKDALPPSFVMKDDELIDKRLTRPIRAEEWFNPQDLTKGGLVTLPEGMDMVSVAVNIEQAVSGFVGPGSRVDILASVKKGEKMTAFPMLVNMLVVAVNREVQIPQGNGTFDTVSTISLAVDREQALLIHLSKQRQVLLSLVLRSQNKKPVDEKWVVADVIKLLEGDNVERGGKPAKTNNGDNTPRHRNDDESGDERKVETVKIPVAKEDVAAGTMITEDLIKEKFNQVEVPAPAPENAVTDLKEFINRSLLNGVAANQWVPKKFIGTPDPKPQPQEGVTQGSKPGPSVDPVKPAEVTQAKPARKTHDVVVQSTNGTRTFRYEEANPGEWKYTGEVFKDGPKADAADQPKAPEAKPEAPKADESPRAVRPMID
jgi:Flp pilus assembly protein CpaB